MTDLTPEEMAEAVEWATFRAGVHNPGSDCVDKECMLARALLEAKARLAWVLTEYNDGNWAGMPEHACEFNLNPEKGACAFHENWWRAMAAAGLTESYLL